MGRSAFSLVELSIVLVILGLLTGGILGGQSLIRAAELRSLSVQITSYQAAVHSFQDKYFSLPGDMTNAQSFWGADDATACANGNIGGNVPMRATCNGNGNGNIDGTFFLESFRFWQHLANSGLIEGAYTGRLNTASADTNIGGAPTACGCYNSESQINSPGTRFANVGFHAWYLYTPSNGVFNDSSSGNGFVIGNDSYDSNQGGFLTPQELWNIDTKIDDSKPGQGLVRAPGWVCADAGDNLTAVYRLDENQKTCWLTYNLQ